MRLQVFSDLHVDVRQPKAIQVVPGIDAVVVAGDVCGGAEHAFAHLPQIVPMQLVCFVLTLAEDRAATARPPARFRALRRSHPGGRS